MIAVGGRRLLAAVDAAASANGLSPGMTLAQAQALVGDLAWRPADPAGERADLERLAGWAWRYTPLVAPDPPDGLWLDITGAAHLVGGEAAVLDDLRARLARAGLAARAAVADTPGAAWAAARFAPTAATVIAPGDLATALKPLPLAALRLSADLLAGLKRLGLTRIGDLLGLARAPLTRRFGPLPARRLDQALGRLPEAIVPLIPIDAAVEHLSFGEPIATREVIAAALDCLLDRLCARLAERGEGARRLDVIFTRVDGSRQALGIGTARANRDARHLARLFAERLDQVDPGFGIEAASLCASRIETMPASAAGQLFDNRAATADIARLIDRLGNRLGMERLYRLAPVESDLPERAVAKIPPLSPPHGRSWNPAWPRPVRLFTPPEPVETTALLPDHPPAAFTWRGRVHRVRQVDGPERILGEWWRDDAERELIRDYYRIEDAEGGRFWLFRLGLSNPARWFLHGLFA